MVISLKVYEQVISLETEGMPIIITQCWFSLLSEGRNLLSLLRYNVRSPSHAPMELCPRTGGWLFLPHPCRRTFFVIHAKTHYGA